MKFDIPSYEVSKKRVVELIKASHDWQNTEGFIADGVICPEIYAKQSVRILCVLAESYGYDTEGDATDIETQLVDDPMGLSNPSVKSVRRLAAVLWLIQQSLERDSKLPSNELPDLLATSEENITRLQGALAKVAWINVKKASRAEGTRMDSTEVYSHALRNEMVIREQIQSIAPTLMLIAGETVFRSMHAMKLPTDEIQLAKKWKAQRLRDGLDVVEVTHPAYRGWSSYAGIYQVFERIYDTTFDRSPE